MHIFRTISMLAILGALADALPKPGDGSSDRTIANVGTARNPTSVPAIMPRSNSWAAQTWTGTSCEGGQLSWSVPDGYSCTKLRRSS